MKTGGFILALVGLLVTGNVLAADPVRPDPRLTPGALNPAVTQATIGKTICKDGWTKTVRPPASFTNRLKLQQMPLYGYDKGTNPHAVEEDHAFPLELGGAPRDPKNLWPEPWEGRYGAHKKDRLETHLKKLVCSKKLTLAQARALVMPDWVTGYIKIFGDLP